VGVLVNLIGQHSRRTSPQSLLVVQVDYFRIQYSGELTTVILLKIPSQAAARRIYLSIFERYSLIVGVAGNSRYTQARETEHPMAYVPFMQPPGVLEMQYELHTTGDPIMLLREAARAVHDTDPNLPLQKPTTQQAQFAETVSQERLIANLSVFFAGLAAFLVAIGLYGTISYGISRRTMEIGVRMALGAQRREVLRMVLLESFSIATVGLGVGIPASLAVATTLRSMLYGLSSSDPLTILVALVGIAMVTLVATFFPAHRTSSMDPMRALRME